MRYKAGDEVNERAFTSVRRQDAVFAADGFGERGRQTEAASIQQFKRNFVRP
jgi:hypothetical protein